MWYKLDENNNPVHCSDYTEHNQWRLSLDPEKQTAVGCTVDRIVINDETVSTVFLAIDHNYDYSSNPKPILFETMIFGGYRDGDQERYSSWDEALEGHNRIVNEIIEKATK